MHRAVFHFALLGLVAGFAAAAACSSQVEVDGPTSAGGASASASGSAGAIGTGGALTSGPTATSATGAGAGSVSSSSGNPPDSGTLCDQACSHVQQCTGFSCAQAGVNCMTVPSGYDCIFECVVNTPCANLSAATLSQCNQQCTADAGDSGPGTTDGGPDAASGGDCTTCMQQKCSQSIQACLGASDCAQWLQCAQSCLASNPTSACFTACDAQYPTAALDTNAIYACSCSNCSAECASEDPCGHVVPDGGL